MQTVHRGKGRAVALYTKTAERLRKSTVEIRVRPPREVMCSTTSPVLEYASFSSHALKYSTLLRNASTYIVSAANNSCCAAIRVQCGEARWRNKNKVLGASCDMHCATLPRLNRAYGFMLNFYQTEISRCNDAATPAGSNC